MNIELEVKGKLLPIAANLGFDAVNTDKLWYFFSDSDKSVLMKPLAGEDLKRETSDKNRYVANIIPSSIFI